MNISMAESNPDMGLLRQTFCFKSNVGLDAIRC